MYQMTASEFKRFCEERTLRFSYSGSMQESRPSSNICTTAKYDSVYVSLMPDIITFNDGRGNYMDFYNVKSIDVDETDGTIEITCKNKFVGNGVVETAVLKFIEK